MSGLSARKVALVGLALLGSTWTHTGSARACDCFPPLSVAEEFEASVAVFLGEVVDHEVVEPGVLSVRRIHLLVLQSWKSVRSGRVCVLTPGSPISCGIVPDIGEQLLVYASGDSSTLLVHSCTRTGMFDGALGDVEILAALGYEPLDLDGPEPGNFDGDGLLELSDFAQVAGCLTGPCGSPPCEPSLYVDPCCAIANSDNDGDVDLKDFAAFQLAFTGG